MVAPMRKIDTIFIHCSASPKGRNDTAAAIKSWHTEPKPLGRGWSDIGYHYVIELDGAVVTGRPESRAGAGVKGHNKRSVHICYVGGMDKNNRRPKDTRTPEQKKSMALLVQKLRKKYPQAEILGHRDKDPSKACPSFDARKEFSEANALAPDMNESEQVVLLREIRDLLKAQRQ